MNMTTKITALLTTVLLAGVVACGCSGTSHADHMASSQTQASQQTEGTFSQVDLAYVKSNIDHIKLVDVRPFEDYTGSASSDERVGHIPGAVSVSTAKILDNEGNPISASRQVRIYERQGLESNDDIVVYGGSAQDVSLVAQQLQQQGYSKVCVCSETFDDWAADTTNEVQKQEEACCALPAASSDNTQVSSSSTKADSTHTEYESHSEDSSHMNHDM